jgi:hypothetical protein
MKLIITSFIHKTERAVYRRTSEGKYICTSETNNPLIPFAHVKTYNEAMADPNLKVNSVRWQAN